MGRPMCGANGSPRRIATQVEYVVVSDGPYRLHTVSTVVCAKIRATNDAFSGSPARLIVRIDDGTPPLSSTACIADGTVCSNVASSARSATASASRTTTTVPPVPHGTIHSNAARSKFSDVAKTVRSSAIEGNTVRAHVTNATILRCSIATPLGAPVEPEV